MQHRIHRRTFLAAAGAGLSAGALRPSAFAAEPVRSSTPSAEKLGWSVACQLYTFRRFPFYEALDKIAALGFRYVEPCFFLALDAKQKGLTTSETLPDAARKELKARLRDRGVEMTNFYGDVTGDAAKNRKVFEFAKEMGVRSIIAEPPPEALEGIEKLCDEFGINLAIHHHAKGTGSRYWDPQAILDACKGQGKRIGACCDTGHWVRSGLNAVECLKKMAGRVLDFHLKDAQELGNRKSRDVPLGEGKADYAAVLKELKRQGYRGLMGIEYEHDSPELMADSAKCVAFVEKTAKE